MNKCPVFWVSCDTENTPVNPKTLLRKSKIDFLTLEKGLVYI
jgi:hypothetical protein